VSFYYCAILNLVSSQYPAALGVKIDVDNNIVESLKNNGIELAFLALHGKYGEDGTIQGMLELLNIPYTGSGVLASAIAINKITTKKILVYEGIPTPDFFVVTGNNYSSNPILIKKNVLEMGLPVVIKAATQGSTIGISFVHEESQIKTAFEEALKFDNEALVEKMIEGIEVTASVLGNENPQALSLIEITSATGVYDYHAKYTVGMSEHIIPPRIDDDIQNSIKELAVKTYLAIGCQGLGRVDFIIDKTGSPCVLEVNTIPGMTETSLFPDAAKASGISFEDLVEKLVQLTMEKYD